MIQSDLSVVNTCTTTVNQWFALNKRLQNADKSEIMFFGTSAQLKPTLSVNVITVTGSSLPITTETRSLGVVLESRLSFDSHVTAASAEPATTKYMGAASHPSVAAR